MKTHFQSARSADQPLEASLPKKRLLLTLITAALANGGAALAQDASTEAQINALLGNPSTTDVRLINTAPIVLTDSLTAPASVVRLDGLLTNNQLPVVNGNGLFRILNVSGAVNDLASVRNIRFTNGATTGEENGGALRVAGNITDGMRNVDVQSNTADQGAALFVAGSFGGGMSGADIRNNVNRKNSTVFVGGNFNGGMVNTTMADNTAQAGVRVNPANSGDWSFTVAGAGMVVAGDFAGGIADSTVRNNSGYGRTGGALTVRGDFDGDISGSTFEGNEVRIDASLHPSILTQNRMAGGAVRVVGTLTGDVTDTTFLNNRLFAHNASGDPAGGTGDGGALAVGLRVGTTNSGGLDGSIIGSRFEGNSAQTLGGALWTTYIGGAIRDTDFIDNHAMGDAGDGGAIYVQGDIGGGIVDSTFAGNSSGSFGGAVFINRNLVSDISGSTFSGNTAASAGGAILINRTMAGGIKGSHFNGNTSGDVGGAFWVFNTLQGGISDGSTFTGNSSARHAGAGYVFNLNGGVQDATFTDNQTATGNGGALYVANLSGGVQNAVFANNRALAGSGGGLNVATNFVGSVQNSAFTDNQARNFGGALYAAHLFDAIEDSAFIGNSAALGGGAVYLGLMDSWMTGLRFVANKAESELMTHGAPSALGGALYVADDFTLGNSAFLGNHAYVLDIQDQYSGAGGAIFHDASISASGAIPIIEATGGNTTVFYGNRHNRSGVQTPNAIVFGNTAAAGNDRVSNVEIYADADSDVLMLDPVEAQADNAVDGAGTAYGNLAVSLSKTGNGTWFLGGENNLPGATSWDVQAGQLALVDVDGTQASINLTHGATSSFTLQQNANLLGSGVIHARDVTLNGTLAPSVLINTGVKAADIDANTTGDDVDVEQSSPYGTLRFTQDVAMNGVVYDVDVSYKAPAGGNPPVVDSDRVQVDGALTATGANLINVTSLSFDGSAPDSDDGLYGVTQVLHADGGITGDFDFTVAGDAASQVDFLRLEGGKNAAGDAYDLRLGLSWYNTMRDGDPAAPKSRSNNAPLLAHGDFTVNGTGTFTLNGPLAVRPGIHDETVMDGSGESWDGNTLNKRGAGTLVLNGVNTYTGLTDVQEGTLRIGASSANSAAQVAGDVQVGAQATLEGHGKVLGNAHIASGGTFSPGSAANTAGVFALGGLTLDAGSTYVAAINPDGSNNKAEVSGAATVNPNANLRIRNGGGAGNWATSTDYTLITAAGGRTGEFSNVTNELAFLQYSLSYDANNVFLRMFADDTPDFTTGCITANQCGIGGALNDDPDGTKGIRDGVISLNVDEVPDAYNSLSGEMFGSTRAALLNDRRLRDAVNRRMLAGIQTDERLWVNAWGFGGDISGNANAAKADVSGIGISLGGDARLTGNLAAGMVFAYEDGKVKNSSGRNSRADVNAYSLGAYLSGEAGNGMTLRAGLIYSRLDIDSKRQIAAGTLQGEAKADYRGNKIQLFVEGSKNFAVGEATTLTPYVNLAQTWLRTDATTETARGAAAPAALHVDSQTDSVTQATLGVRAGLQVSPQTRLVGELGYVRSFGDVDGKTTNRFASSNRNFAIRGVAVDKTMALVGVGIQAQLSPAASLSVGYQGQIGSKVSNHGAHVQFRMRF